MRLDAFEVRPEPQLDHLELGELREDAVVARSPRDLLATPRRNQDSSDGFAAHGIDSPFTVHA